MGGLTETSPASIPHGRRENTTASSRIDCGTAGGRHNSIMKEVCASPYSPRK